MHDGAIASPERSPMKMVNPPSSWRATALRCGISNSTARPRFCVYQSCERRTSRTNIPRWSSFATERLFLTSIPLRFAFVTACYGVENLGIPRFLEILEGLPTHCRIDVQVRRPDDSAQFL